jgi:hypothetical protein
MKNVAKTPFRLAAAVLLLMAGTELLGGAEAPRFELRQAPGFRLRDHNRD